MDRQCRCVHNSVSNQTLYKPWVFYEIGVIIGVLQGAVYGWDSKHTGTVLCHILYFTNVI